MRLRRGPRPWSRLPGHYRLFEQLDELTAAEPAEVIERRAQREAAILREHPDGLLPGRCLACGATSGFRFPSFTGGDPPNWRETLECECGLFSRVRATAEVLHALVPKASSVYLTERVTPLYRHVDEHWRQVAASEFVGDDAVPGSLHLIGGTEVRHEDLTRLSYGDASFDVVASMDVLEHVPAFQDALREMARVLRRGGLLVLSAPFVVHAPATLVRARLRDDGTVEHLEEPEMHGDPANPEGGILAFYHFGWDLLPALRAAGFRQVALARYWSEDAGHLGGGGALILGRR